MSINQYTFMEINCVNFGGEGILYNKDITSNICFPTHFLPSIGCIHVFVSYIHSLTPNDGHCCVIKVGHETELDKFSNEY